MPVKIIGMIGVAPPSSDASLHVIEGGLSPSYLAEFARAHDRAGFDMVLVGVTVTVHLIAYSSRNSATSPSGFAQVKLNALSP